ncbi:MAG: pilin [Zoogloeaceae bacterium]|nr:pilin [Zoogloeaceae bacterium]
MAKTQATRVYGETNNLRTAIELCILEGRTSLGTGKDDCDPSYTASNLVSGDPQVGGTAAKVAGAGFPQVLAGLGGGSGAIITATFGNKAALVLRKSTLTLNRSKRGSWTCKVAGTGFEGEQEKYIPGSCTT